MKAKEEKIRFYSTIVIILACFLFFFFSFFEALNIHGHSSEGSTPSSVSITVLSTCGNGILETPYEECDDGNTISGDGCSATCIIEEPALPEPPEIPPTEGLFVDPLRISRNMLINSNIEENVGITNLGSSSVDVSISSLNFDPDLIVLFWNSRNFQWVNSMTLSLSAGDIYNLRVRFSAPGETGIYGGFLNIGGKRVNVTLNVKEKLILFDSNIIVLNENYIVPQGDRLRTSVTLIPLGDKERMDVTLNYVIKDYEGRAYIMKSETVLVEEQVNFKRNFETGSLPLGKYIIGLELIYPNGVAPSSAHFEVTTARQNTLFGKLVFFIINLILIILVLLVIMIILRILKQLRENRKQDEKGKILKEIRKREGIKDDSETKEKEKNEEKEEE